MTKKTCFVERIGGIPTVLARQASSSSSANMQIAQFDTMPEARRYAAEQNDLIELRKRGL
jgi:hypothetical protein